MIVTQRQLDELHRRLRAETRDPRAGVFGPASAMWRLSRESALFLGGGRALLLQLAHPTVAHAVAQHSQLAHDPLGRFQRTFEGVFGMIFGDLDEALARSRAVYAVHARVHGPIGEDVGAFAAGTRYHANEAGALLWVHATLIDTSVMVYELVVGALSPAEKEAYYQDSKRFAALFGLAEDAVPADWHAFTAYVQGMLDSSTIAIGATARELAKLLFTAGDPARRSLYRVNQAVTTGLLPGRLRADLGLRWDAAARATSAATIAAARAALPLLPARLRYAPAYMHARRRLAGKRGPDRLSRLVERLAVRAVAAPTGV